MYGVTRGGQPMYMYEMQHNWMRTLVVRNIYIYKTFKPVVIAIIITTLLQKDMVPHNHCLVFILSIGVMTLLILFLFFLN